VALIRQHRLQPCHRQQGRTGRRDPLDRRTHLPKGTATLKPVILSLGGNYQYISGTEKLTGTPLTENNDIQANKNLSALAGIDVMISGGTIGFHGEWGARNSFALVFARDF
jgi:hypothetical protein